MSAWVKPTSYVGTKWPTVYQYGSPGHATLGVAAQETTDGIIEHWQNDSTAVHGTNPATFNDWNHIAIVRDATNTTFYLNGSPDGSAASVTINDGEKSWIGGTENNSPGDDDFLGLIDEVRVSAGSNSDFSADWMVASDFSYTDVSGGGAASVSSMWTDTDGTDNVVTIAVNAAFNSDDFYTDLIAPASNQIYDLVDVAASTTAVAITTDISISSAANQIFIVGDPVTPAAIITITESATTATITRKNDLRIRIPASFNMTWDTSVTDVTIGGGAAGKVRTKLRKYEDADKTAVVDVSADFSVGDKITIDGLTVMSFVVPSPADNLELEVGRDGVVTAEDDKTITVGAGGTAVLSSGTNQIFSVGNPSTPMSPISVSDAATATITAANDIRIRIPAAFNMTWDSGITTATLGGSAAAKVNASVSFEDGDRTLVLNVNTDFADSDTLTISGLNYFNFTAVSTADNLELEIDNLGNVVDEDDKTIVVSDVSISSAAPQTFTVGDPSTAASTITDGTSASIRKKEDLRIRIPAGVDMAWDTSVVSVTLGGAAAGKVKADLKNYEDNGKTAVIDIQDDFVGSDQFTIDGLAFMGFATPSGPGRLELETGNDDIVVDVDDKTITIIAGPTNILSANDQTFNLGNPPTPIATITVTDGATPAITAANDLRIRIPGGFNMTWDSSDVTAVIGGPAAAKVSNTVGYENVNQTLLVTVNTDFAAGEWITISGLSFANYTANSPADNLELVTDGAAQTEIDRDDKTILVTDLTITSAASQSFTVGDAATLAATITITDDTVSATITNKKDLRIRIPSTFPMKWDPTITNVTVGGAAAAKVKTKLKNYEDGGRTAVVNVSADFVAGDQVTIADLRFVDFAAPAVFDNLELEVFKDGLLSALDDKTVNIVAGPVNILSDEDQSFGFSDIATTISPITVTDAATPAITAANDIRIRIPAAIEIVWDGAATTAILGGPAASKVSGTVSYEDLGKTLVLDVTADFAAGDHIVIAGLRYTGFAPPSGLDFLELLIDGGTVVIDTDDHSLSLHGAFISSALDQTFIVNEAPKQAETITITDDTVLRVGARITTKSLS